MPTHVVDISSKPTRANSLARLLWHIFSFSYGSFNLVAFVTLAFWRKANFRRLNDKSRKELSTAQDKLWNLNSHPDGLNHRFCVLRNGIKLHYVEALPHRPTPGNSNLVIFLHGFPDSWALWRQQLRCGRLREHTTMVACDLPGHGGSDSLTSYGPDQVLEAIAEYMLQMREKYLTPEEINSRVVVAAHDWGALIAFRLASEAPQLADRFILSNSLHPALAHSNVKNRLASASRMLHTWLRNPLDLRLLRRVFSNASPLFRQIIKSGYIFVFNLPRPMVNILAAIGDHWFLRFANAKSTHPDPPKPLEGAHGAEMLASSLGPSMAECVATAKGDELSYPHSVIERAQRGSWFQKIGVYRDGLAFSPWTKSLQILWDLNQIQQGQFRRRSSSGAGLFDTGPQGSLLAPVTIVWGKDDLAIENAVAVEGIRDFFGVKGSQLITIQKCGHWTPIERQGAPVFEEVIAWAVGGEVGSLQKRLGGDYPLVTIVTER